MERGRRRDFFKSLLDKYGKPILPPMQGNALNQQFSNLANRYYNEAMNALNNLNQTAHTFPANDYFTPYTPNPYPPPNPFPPPQAASQAQSTSTSTNEVGNAAEFGPKPPPSKSSSVVPELVEQAQVRPHSARIKLGDAAVLEACKGLSRVLNLGDEQDLHTFGTQLCTTDRAAIVDDYKSCTQQRVPCFAVSYVQHKPSSGRFKFSPAQWENLHCVLQALHKDGVTTCRIWLDQCLWLRDASQGAWAHTGILPYILWPVISLGDKVVHGDRTVASYERMWPFVEEVAGLWSLGVLTASEMRGKNPAEGVRRSVTFNHRLKLEPERSLKLLLLNIYHGAADGLKTGWQEDVKELKDMARWNVHCMAEVVIVGVDWRTRISSCTQKQIYNIMEGLKLSRKAEYFQGSANLFLDGSRKYARGSWSGYAEWLSGNECVTPSSSDWMLLNMGCQELYNVVTDRGEFQLLGRTSYGAGALWLLVAMDERSSNVLRGKVAWTKVVSGLVSCLLPGNVATGDTRVISLALSEQLGVDVKVFSAKSAQGNLEWC